MTPRDDMTATRPPLRVIPGGLSDPRQLGAAVADADGGSRRRWRGAYGLLAGYCLTAVATVAAVAAGGTRHPGIALAVVAFGVFAAARWMTMPAALGSGVIGWLFYNGFIVGRHGALRWAGPREAWWLLLLLAAAGSGWALGWGVCRIRRRAGG